MTLHGVGGQIVEVEADVGRGLPGVSIVVVDEVGWVAEDLGDGTRLTSFGHEPAIEVIVPQEQGPGPLLLPAFSEAVEELPTNGRECS